MNLRKYFNSTGIKMVWLAKKAKVTPGAIHKILKGNDILLSTAVRISRATNGQVTIEDLYRSLRKNDPDYKRDHANKEKQKDVN